MNVLYNLRRMGIAVLSVITMTIPASLSAQQQARELTGVVTDSAGDPLIGAAVFIDGESGGVATDNLGRYSINVRSGQTLIFSYIGHADARVLIENQLTLNMTLESLTTDIDEVIVVGYGVQRKRDVTGSISSVRSEDLATTVTAANPMQALQGKVAGVDIVQNSAPGGSPTVRVRGVGSFRNTAPCYVVDGLIMDDISFLNPNEIESMEVLKDASSTAIYGSRGANGVIIVTTKQGRKNQPLNVQVDANFSFAEMSRYLPYANASQYLQLKNMYTQAWNAIRGTDDPMPYTDAEIAAAGKGTDWQKEITRMAFTQNYNINITGGGEKSTYGVTAGFFDQEGIMKQSDYKRANVKVTNTYDLTKWATFGSNISFIYEQRHSQGSTLSSALRALPTATIMDPDDPDKFFGPVDEIGKSGNPVAALYYNSDNYYNVYRTIANFYVNLELYKNLYFRSSFTLNNANTERKSFLPSFFVNTEQKRDDNQLEIEQTRRFDWLNENTLTYSYQTGKHRINAVVGITAQEIKSQNQNQTVRKHPDTAWKNRNLWYIGLGDASTLTGGSSGTDYTYISYLARANYNFDNKYMIQGTIRVDGSSRFPTDGRYGTFPAVGAGWSMQEEEFLRDVSWLNQLKLRTSYGVVGSDAGIPNNIQTVYVNNVTGVFGKNPTSATVSQAIDMTIDAGLHWEEARQFDIGFDFSALNQRLTLEFDYYRKTTKDILTAVNLPGVSGSTYAPLYNVATARNWGFEWNLGWRDNAGEFAYHANFVGSTLKNKVTSVNRDLPPIENSVNRTLVGYPIGGFWGYEVLGIYQDQTTIDQTANISGARPGDIWYKDQNGDGTIDTNDRVYLGSYLPKVTLGLNLGFEWKGLDFSMDLYASLGNKIYSLRRQELGNPNYNVSWDDFKNAWTGPGSTNRNTSVLFDGPGTNNNFSEYFLEDGSYFRIRNIVIGYSLPKTIVNKMYMKNLRVYVAANNLLTVTNATGYSPEAGADPNTSGRDNFTNNYPAARTFSVGLSVNF